MVEESTLSLPTGLPEKAVAHALEKFGVYLYPELFYDLYEEHLARRRELEFEEALVAILDETYTRNNPQEENLYKAIKSSFGVVAAGMKAAKKKRRESFKKNS